MKEFWNVIQAIFAAADKKLSSAVGFKGIDMGYVVEIEWLREA